VTVTRSILLFVLAPVSEIGEHGSSGRHPRHHGLLRVALGIVALGAYGLFVTLQPDSQFGRTLATYGGALVAGSLAWGMASDGFRPDRSDVFGGPVCLVGVGVIMYAPRGA
jgi:small multidrug resistance family-3 protein